MSSSSSSSSTASRAADIDGWTLGAVTVFFRHGDRATLHTVEEDGEAEVARVWRPLVDWNCADHGWSWPQIERDALARGLQLRLVDASAEPGEHKTFDRHGVLGQLTPRGWAQSVALGARLRRAYGSLPVVASSTNSRRTIQTALGVWTGLTGGTRTNGELTVRVHSNTCEDPLLAYSQLPETREAIKCLRAFTAQVLEPTLGVHARVWGALAGLGLRREGQTMTALHDNYVCRAEHGLLQYVREPPLQRLLSFFWFVKWDIVWRNTALLNTAVAPVSKLIRARAAGPPRLFLEACHDMTLVMLLKAWGDHTLPMATWPAYGSAVIVESWHSPDGCDDVPRFRVLAPDGSVLRDDDRLVHHY